MRPSVYSPGNDIYKKGNNLFVHGSTFKKNHNFSNKSSVKHAMVYSWNYSTMLSKRRTYGPYYGTNDFIQKDVVDNWYGSYYIASYKSTTLNKQGPKFRWYQNQFDLVLQAIMCYVPDSKERACKQQWLLNNSV